MLTLAIAAVLTAVLFARPRSTPGPPMRDFESYYAAGIAVRADLDPYGTAIWSAEKHLPGVSAGRNEVLPFVGPPALLPVFAALARLSFPQANILWRAALVAALMLLMAATLRVCRITPSFTAFLIVAVFALGFGPLTSALALGQIALPAFACAAISLLWLPAAVFAWAQPNVALPLLACWVERKGGIAVLFSAGIFAAACLIVAGPAGISHYIATLHAHQRAERFSAIQLTPAAIAYGFGASESAAGWIGLIVAIVAVAFWIVVLREARDVATRFCLTCIVLPLTIPFFHEHDLLVTFLPAVYFAGRCGRRTWPLTASGALLCATDWLGLAQRPDGEIQTLLLVGAAGIALFLMRTDLAHTALLVPLAALVLIAIVPFAAAAHPAPVWPDAMRAVPTVYGNDIAAIWHAEQRSAGLFTRNAVWAALRALSLTGCVVLGISSFFSLKSAAHSKSPLPVPA